jgi:predicted 2-oxoglutarate/Fe(II)-dependent dioxygenase YbiX
MIIQVENALGAKDCRRLMTMYDRHVHLTQIRDQTGFPVVYWSQFREAPYADEIVARLIEECLRNIDGQLRPAKKLYPETVILAAMGAGGHLGPHADNCRLNDQGDWVANHTPQRDISAVWYLNDEFDGGEIFFQQAQLAVKSCRGLLLAFSSGADHLHEVFPVRSGFRYTMPIWFTNRQCYALADSPRGEAT